MAGRSILTISSLALFLVGWALMLAPGEMASWMGVYSAETALPLQLFGGALLGFAILNWMSRGNRIGGIYGRPLALANLLLFTSAALALGKAAAAGTAVPHSVGACVGFSFLAVAFAWLTFFHDPIPR